MRLSVFAAVTTIALVGVYAQDSSGDGSGAVSSNDVVENSPDSAKPVEPSVQPTSDVQPPSNAPSSEPEKPTNADTSAVDTPEPSPTSQVDNNTHEESSQTRGDPKPSIPDPETEQTAEPTSNPPQNTTPTRPGSRTSTPNVDAPTPSSHNQPTPTKAPTPTQYTNPSKPSTSATKRTVVAMVTVMVDGEPVVSSHTTVIDDAAASDTGNDNDEDSTDNTDADGTPYTSTIMEDGSAIVVTGLLKEESHSSGASQVKAVHMQHPVAILGTVAAMAIAALF